MLNPILILHFARGKTAQVGYSVFFTVSSTIGQFERYEHLVLLVPLNM